MKCLSRLLSLMFLEKILKVPNPINTENWCIDNGEPDLAPDLGD